MTLLQILVIVLLLAAILGVIVWTIKLGASLVLEIIIWVMVILAVIFLGSMFLDLLLKISGHEQVIFDGVFKGFKFIGESIAALFN